MRWLLILLLVMGCNTEDRREKAMIIAKEYCSCQKGVYIISFSTFETYFTIHCNNGESKMFSYNDYVKGLCK